MPIKLKNNTSGFLATAISASDTGLVLQTGNGAAFPTLSTADYFYATLISTGGTQEVVKVTARVGDTMTVVRAQEGSSAAGFAAGSRLELRVTAQSVLDVGRDYVSVKDFGAVGDGVTDDTNAIQAAIDVVTVGGGIVFIPKGVYQVTNITLKDGVTLQGEGAFASVIRATSATATVVTMNASSFLRELKFISSVARTAGFYANVQGNGTVIDNCEFDGYFIGVNVGTVGGTQAVNCLIKYCEFRNPVVASGSGAAQFMNFSNAQMRDCVITGPGRFVTQPDFGVRFRNGDTAFISGTNITAHGKALIVDPAAASNCYALTIDGSLFDSANEITGGGSVPCAEFIPGGGVWNTKISNTWFGLSTAKSGCYVGRTGSGVVDGITFTGCEFTDNGDNGLIVDGPGVTNWIVTGGHSGGNTSAGIRAASGTTDFVITGHRAGTIAGRGANGDYGIRVTAHANDRYVINGCHVIGNTTGGILDLGTGTNARVTDNLGYNGTETTAGVVVGASPWSYTAGHTPETMYFAGGTLTEIRVDGAIVQNTTGATISLVPNQVMSVTYSVAPTVMRKKS